MIQKKRMANYELLRVLAMLMVVTMHYLSNGEGLPVLGKPLTGRTILGAGLESLCIVAVNVYVLISGYFIIDSGFRVSRIVKLIFQVLFYAILIPCILYPMGMPTVAATEGFYGVIQYIFPIETGHYWFATSYVFMYLFSPIINIAVKNMTKKQLSITLGGVLILFCGMKSISPVAFAFDRYGYDFGWFLCVYLTAAYIRMFGFPFLEKGKRGALLYLASAMGIFLIIMGTHHIYEKTGAFAYYFTVPYHYNFILCLFGAVGLFYAFSKVTIKGKRTAELFRFLGPLSFGVYLFHEHIDLRYVWFDQSMKIYGGIIEGGVIGFLLHLLLTVFLIFIIGIVIDCIRNKIFAFAGKGLTKTKLGEAMARLDSHFITR